MARTESDCVTARLGFLRANPNVQESLVFLIRTSLSFNMAA